MNDTPKLARQLRAKDSMAHNQAIIQKFISSNAKSVKLVGWKHSNAYECQKQFQRSALRMGCPHIVSKVKGGEVYLINTLLT